uniref:WD repeat-containing protein 35 n=1 Tax=Panagrolaimus sp. PS1159 TaxID=55785 RepID=A0AC35FT61_9BILA
MYYGNLEAAEKIYLDNDRRDLAIDMHRKMNNWPRILKLLQTSGASNSDALMIEAWKEVGDWFAERQKWAMAAKHYASGNHFDELVDCYIKLDDFGKMEQLMHQLPDSHAVLLRLAEHFSSAGLCELAVDCYVRCEQHETALDTSIKLNQWDMAVDISKRYHLRDVESLLGKYTVDLTGNHEKTMAAVQLFRKAGKFLLAARKVFEMAQEETNNATAKRLKKLYVLGALLVEMYRDQNKAQLTKDKDNNIAGVSSATVALQGLLEEDKSLSMADARLIDTAWRGAEAWHFLMLAHQQLYAKEYVSALKTCLVVSEYDEFVDTYEIHCMLALVAIHARQFGIASKAFMKINSLPNVNDEEKEKYNQLAMEIFLKYPPQDTRDAKIECTSCEAVIPDCSIVCPNASCNTRFPICIASGRPLLDYQFWLCPSCKHRAYEQEIQSYKFCPLCHCEI